MNIDHSNVVSNNNFGSNSQVTIIQNKALPRFSDIPHQLCEPPDLFDRLSIREELTSSIESGKRVFVFYGYPGVGKSSCLFKFANDEARRFTDGQISIDLSLYRRDDGSLELNQLYSYFIKSLGFDFPTDRIDPSGYFRTITKDKNLLIVLDNVITSSDIDPFVIQSGNSLVLSAGACKYTGTMYQHLSKSFSIDCFDAKTSIEYLRYRLSSFGFDCDISFFENSDFQELIDICGGLPIILDRAACLLSSDCYSTEEIIVSLSDSTDSPLNGALNLETAHFSTHVSSLYALFGQLEGAPIALSAFSNDLNFKRAVSFLIRRSLLQCSDTNWFGSCSSLNGRKTVSMHWQIANCAGSYKPLDTTLFDSLGRRVVNYYAHLTATLDHVLTPDRLRVSCSPFNSESSFDEIAQTNAADYFLSIRFEILSVVKFAFCRGLYRQCLCIADSCWTFVYDNGLFDFGVTLFTYGSRAAQKLQLSDAEARMCALKSRCLLCLNSIGDAEAAISYAIQISQDSENHTLKGSLLEFEGHTYKDGCSNPVEAINFYKAAISEYELCEPVNDRGIAIANYSIAECYISLKRFKSALTLIELCLDSCNNLEPNMLSKIELKGSLCLFKLGNFSDALSLLQKCCNSCFEGGLSGVAADAYSLRGDIELECGRVSNAIGFYQSSYDLYAQLGDLKNCSAIDKKLLEII